MNKLVLLFSTLLLLLVGFTACDAEGVPPAAVDCEHVFSEWVTVKEANCSEEGEETRACTKCFTPETRALERNGNHSVVIDEGYDATCTADGLSDGEHCGLCSEILVQQQVIPGGHAEVTDNAIPATCTEDGLTEGKHCSRCNEPLVPQSVIPALKHIEVIDAGFPATCTEDGLTEGKHCSRCGDILVSQESVPAMKHNEVLYNGKQPTCTEDGWADYVKCTRFSYTT